MCPFVQFYINLSVYLCTPKVKGHNYQFNQIKNHIYILCVLLFTSLMGTVHLDVIEQT